ncbi:hypothetical protein RhiirC2_799397 [Rhizophagus irregularis]|uniref:Uncharacterized protein n=1 Tax=Rhizophagus irregularis TaxID=588596 RepID=A0A2N1M546_9GLOM|nr:hypothetical protein RhiirC2_799397 [Rhizophagus irregularis]
MQAFLTTPKYNKFYIYKTPTSQYQRFCNAFGYHSIEDIENKIREYLAIPIPIQGFMRINQSQSSSSQNPRSAQTNQVLQRPIEEIIVADSTLPPNAAVQKKAVETINTINTKLAKLQ